MDKTTVVAVTPSVSGNVGSCQVNSQDIPVSSWTIETVAVNSCTGDVVAQNTYLSWLNVFSAFLFVFAIVIFIGLTWKLIKD